MRQARLIGLGLVGVIFGVGLGCESSEGDEGGSANFCPALEGYVSPCDEPTVCERALARDCDPLEAVLQPEVAASVSQCMLALGQPQDCFDEATDRSTTSAIVEDFATAICLECGDGSGDCESDVLSGDDDSELARAGRLARVLTRDVLEKVQDECTTGDSCAAAFEGCAKQVLAREIPSATAGCMVDAVYDDYSSECGDTAGSTTGTDTDTDTTDPTSPTFPTDPTNATDPTDPTDTGETDGDTDGGCDDVGCACMFNEDCVGELVCPEGTCVSAAECGEDTNEPNNGEMQAALLGPISDDDDDGTMLAGELEAPTDIDWFLYEGEDTSFAIVSPFAQVNINDLELCIHAECVNGLENTEVSCNKGTTLQPSPGGRPGCCGTNTSGFEISMSCGGTFTDDSALIYMSVAGSEPGVCQEYTLTYNF